MKANTDKPRRFCSKCKHHNIFADTTGISIDEPNTICDICCAERNWQESDSREITYAPKWEPEDDK